MGKGGGLRVSWDKHGPHPGCVHKEGLHGPNSILTPHYSTDVNVPGRFTRDWDPRVVSQLISGLHPVSTLLRMACVHLHGCPQKAQWPRAAAQRAADTFRGTRCVRANSCPLSCGMLLAEEQGLPFPGPCIRESADLNLRSVRVFQANVLYWLAITRLLA